jgi:ADP-ribosylglycohydrolase
MAVARAQASLTHADPAAGWGAAIQAELIRRAIMGHDPIAEIGTVLESLANDHMMKMMSPSSTDMSMMKPDASEAKAEAQKCSIR